MQPRSGVRTLVLLVVSLLLVGVVAYRISTSWDEETPPSGAPAPRSAPDPGQRSVRDDPAAAQPAEPVARVEVGESVARAEPGLDDGRAVRVVGTVRDENGAPVSRADVYVRDPADAKASTSPWAAVESGADGRFELSLRGGTLDLVDVGCVCDGYMPAHVLRVTVAPGRVTNVDFVLRRGERIEGIVLDPDGVPIPGLEIVAARPFEHPPRAFASNDALDRPERRRPVRGADAWQTRTTTGDDGRFVVTGLHEAGTEYSLVSADPEWIWVAEIVEAGARGVVLEARHARGVVVHVRDGETGLPVDGRAIVELSLRGVDERGRRQTYAIHGTGEGGEVQIAWLPRVLVGSMAVQVSCSGYETGSWTWEFEGPGVTERTVALQPIHAERVDLVVWSSAMGPVESELRVSFSAGARSASQRAECTSLGGGHYRAELPVGEWRLRVGRKSDVTSLHTWTGDVSVVEGRPNVVRDIVLGGATIEIGRAVDDSTSVMVQSASLAAVHEVEGERVLLTGLPVASYEIRIDDVTRDVAITSPDQVVVIRVP
jgi:hypothetical protein